MCLPMGCSISCALWEKFAHFIQWVVQVKTGLSSLNHYLDDFFFAVADAKTCGLLMNSFQNTCNYFSIPLVDDKTMGPCTKILFLGIIIDTEKMVIKIPDDKTSVLKETLVTMLCKEKVTLRELQSLVASLNFCAKAIQAARAFNRRFCDAMCGVTKPLHHIRLTECMKSDMRVWLNFIEQFNGTLNFMELNWSSNEDLHLYTDSAGNKNLGCGVYLQGHWAYFGWPEK